MMKLYIIIGLLIQLSLCDNCWKDAYGRGVGKPISSCPENYEQNGLLCYPLCKEGFTGVGPVCWQNCPSDFTDTGAHCTKPAAYGRGAGWVSESKCESKESQDCERWGLLWYPKCQQNFHSFGCCICSPNCPAGMTDIGVGCQKQSYGRTAGIPLQCKPDEEDNSSLCYPKCKSGYQGNGPVCWAKCPLTKTDCSALCTDSVSECSSTVKSIVSNVFGIASAVAAVIASGQAVNMQAIIDKMGTLATDLANGICERPTLLQQLLGQFVDEI